MMRVRTQVTVKFDLTRMVQCYTVLYIRNCKPQRLICTAVDDLLLSADDEPQ